MYFNHGIPYFLIEKNDLNREMKILVEDPLQNLEEKHFESGYVVYEYFPFLGS